MSLSGIQKAALLLTALDQSTAAELLKGQPQGVVQRVAMELSRWDGKIKKNTDKVSMIASEFCTRLMENQDGELNIRSFIGTLIQDTNGNNNTIRQAAMENDPFLVISDASPAHLVAALEKEPPQAIAVILAELAPKLCTEVLTQLPDEKAQLVLWRMTQSKEVSGKTVRRIAEIISKRLVEIESGEEVVIQDTASKETLRQVALVLNGMSKDERGDYLKQIQSRDENIASMVRALMIAWEDILKIEDKSLQETFRNLEATVFAKALHGADVSITEKINSNLSERMKDMVEEEASLMGKIRKKDILSAREEIVKPLREALEAGELAFIEEEDVE